MNFPVELFYLPPEQGGLGMKSMMDVVNTMRVSMGVAAVNDCCIHVKGGR